MKLQKGNNYLMLSFRGGYSPHYDFGYREIKYKVLMNWRRQHALFSPS